MRIPTGLGKMDKMISGGFPEHSVILLSGGPGTGKTLFALKFLLEGAKKGEKCCYATLNESREELLKACESIKSLSCIKNYLDKNIVIEHIPLDEGSLSLGKFVNIIAKNYPKLDRIVVDNVNKLMLYSDSKSHYRVHLAELVRTLRNTRSAILLCETDSDERMDSGNYESFECDGVVQLMFLELEERPMRVLVVHKMRYTNFEAKLPHEISISDDDIEMTKTRVI